MVVWNLKHNEWLLKICRNKEIGINKAKEPCYSIFFVFLWQTSNQKFEI